MNNFRVCKEFLAFVYDTKEFDVWKEYENGNFEEAQKMALKLRKDQEDEINSYIGRKVNYEKGSQK